MNGRIMLSNGELLNLTDPDPAAIDIEVIAHSLSQLCRFTGHTRRFYSVAEHCVLVSTLVPQEYARNGLLHDAAEAFVGDMAAPLKAIQPEYRLIEVGIESAIEERFGVTLLYPRVHRVIKEADLMACAIEVRELMPGWENSENWIELPTPHIEMLKWDLGWAPDEAERRFLERYEELRT